VRIDGADDEEDVVVAANAMRPWSMDGPGDPVRGCTKGDVVWLKSDGAWYPAKVRQTTKSGRCTVRLEDEDVDKTVELRRLRVITR
jgi:hypothetical protein